jgi:hypothetical protein
MLTLGAGEAAGGVTARIAGEGGAAGLATTVAWALSAALAAFAAEAGAGAPGAPWLAGEGTSNGGPCAAALWLAVPAGSAVSCGRSGGGGTSRRRRIIALSVCAVAVAAGLKVAPWLFAIRAPTPPPAKSTSAATAICRRRRPMPGISMGSSSRYVAMGQSPLLARVSSTSRNESAVLSARRAGRGRDPRMRA